MTITTIAHAILTIYRRDCTSTKPPNDLQRNIVQQNQHRQEENRRQRQKQPRYRQWDRARRNSGEDGPQTLDNDSGWIFFLQADIRRFNLPRDMTVRLCRRCVAVGRECTHGANCDIGVHATFAPLFQTDQDIVSNWAHDSHSLD